MIVRPSQKKLLASLEEYRAGRAKGVQAEKVRKKAERSFQ